MSPVPAATARYVPVTVPHPTPGGHEPDAECRSSSRTTDFDPPPNDQYVLCSTTAIRVPAGTVTVRPSSPSSSRTVADGDVVNRVGAGVVTSLEALADGEPVASGDGEPVGCVAEGPGAPGTDGDGDAPSLDAPPLQPLTTAAARTAAANPDLTTASSSPSRHLIVTVIVLNSLTPSGNVTVVLLPPAVTDSV
jgi:hypothetical protein